MIHYFKRSDECPLWSQYSKVYKYWLDEFKGRQLSMSMLLAIKRSSDGLIACGYRRHVSPEQIIRQVLQARARRQ